MTRGPRRTWIGLLAAALFASAPAAAQVSTGRELAVTGRLVEGPARAGALNYIGGVRLASRDPDFRELSGLAMTTDGRLVAVTDGGFLFEVRLAVRERGLAFEEAHLFELPQGAQDERGFAFSSAAAPAGCAADRPRSRAEKYDAEAIAALDDDFYAVAFERNHRIQCYRRLDGLGGPPRLALELCPPQVRRADAALAPAVSAREVEGNCGVEGLAFDRADGALLMLSERPDGAHFPVWALHGDAPPRFLRRSFAPVAGEAYAAAFARAVGAQSPPATPYASEYRPSDAALLGDDLLALERYPLARGGPYAARIMRMPGAKHAQAELAADCLAELGGYPPANYEGLAMAPQENGGAVLALVSDDGDDRRGTVLLMFRLPAGSSSEGACAD